MGRSVLSTATSKNNPKIKMNSFMQIVLFMTMVCVSQEYNTNRNGNWGRRDISGFNPGRGGNGGYDNTGHGNSGYNNGNIGFNNGDSGFNNGNGAYNNGNSGYNNGNSG